MSVTWNPGNVALSQQLANFSSNFVTAPGPFGGTHMLAVAMLPAAGFSLKNAHTAYFSDAPIQRNDQFKPPSSELRLELSLRWTQPISYLARDHFGGADFEVAQSGLGFWKPDEYAMAAMKAVSISYFNDLVMPPIGTGEVQGDKKVRDAASLLIRGIYAFWKFEPDLMPHRVVIGVREKKNFDRFVDSLREESGGVLKDQVTPQGIIQTISELMHSVRDTELWRLDDIAAETPFLFSREQVQRLSDALYDKSSNLHRTAFGVLRKLALSNFGPIKFQAGQALAEYGLTYRYDK